MIQFEEVIIEESRNICEQLSSYATKEGRHTSFVGMSPTKDSLDFDTFKPLKRATVAIRAILLIIIALIAGSILSCLWQTVFYMINLH